MECLLTAALCLALKFSCTTPQDTASPPPSATPALDFRPDGPIPDSELGQYYAELSCSIEGGVSGTIVLEMWADKAPKTVRNFLRYCSEGFYDGLSFHRILREFMIQGGDPKGNGTGSGTYGNIPDEFSSEQQWGHGYGVISMAHSGRPNTASCQFFICSADTRGVFRLDGKYASFGKLVSGVEMLEAIASVPTARSNSNEPSRPTKKVTITSARVRLGGPETRQAIQRPQPDLGEQPAKVVVQQILVSFAGGRTKATRSKEDAAALAEDLHRRVQAGEDFEALLRQHTDETIPAGATEVGILRVLNQGAFDPESERAMHLIELEGEQQQKALESKFSRGEIDGQTMSKELERLQAELATRSLPYRWVPRSGLQNGRMGALADAAFTLAVGETVLLPHDPKTSALGWHILRRVQ